MASTDVARALDRAAKDVSDFPRHEMPYRDQWLRAMKLVATEMRMRAVIDAQTSAPVGGLTATGEQDLGAGGVLAPRRTRVTV